ncbi:hypothetical protein M8J76_000366 [Diaphorina citri]|nr:hypothetical protein M8J76_000366 [Diaphorina citri]KAI5743598.1 hypothetical protein M8J77_020043 [Diaphorina citri]
MPCCFSIGCKHTPKESTCKFYRFPINKEKRKKWDIACRRGDIPPTKDDRLCSCHFVDGDKSKTPSIFNYNEEKKFTIENLPNKRKRTPKVKYDPADQKPKPIPSAPVIKKRKTSAEAVPVTNKPKAKVSFSTDDSPMSDSSTNNPSSIRAVNPSLSNSTKAPSSSNSTKAINPSSSKSNRTYSSALKSNKENDVSMVKKMFGESRMSFSYIQNNDAIVYNYTGLPTAHHFLSLVKLIQRFEFMYIAKWSNHQLSLEDQLLCCLMKLKLNLEDFDLAFRFKVSSAIILNVVITFVLLLHNILFKGMMDTIPRRQDIEKNLPTCLATFPRTRMILYCVQIEVAKPSKVKLVNTLKVLIGVAPNSTIIFVSALFPGFMSDKQITLESKVLNHMEFGDMILSEKSFLLRDPPRNEEDNQPPFLKDPELLLQKIADARKHVEETIHRLKSFKILDLISSDMRGHSCKIIQTCAALTNLQHTVQK